MQSFSAQNINSKLWVKEYSIGSAKERQTSKPFQFKQSMSECEVENNTNNHTNMYTPSSN